MTAVTAGTARGDATRRTLLDAARSRFARDGYRATSVADISRDAGVGSTTAYVHYANKESLFLAAVDDDLASLFLELSEALTALGDPDKLGRGVFPIVLELLGAHPLAHRLVAGLEPDMTRHVVDTASFDVLRQTVADLVGQGQQAGQIRGDVEASALADGFVAMVVAVAMAAVQVGDHLLETFGDGLTALFRVALTPDPRLEA